MAIGRDDSATGGVDPHAGAADEIARDAVTRRMELWIIRAEARLVPEVNPGLVLHLDGQAERLRQRSDPADDGILRLPRQVSGRERSRQSETGSRR